jgi:hypothetical protein
VAVRGHSKQPTLLDCALAHTVEVDACSWSLSGEGGQRALLLTLEKASAGLRWTALMLAADGEGAEVGAVVEARRMEELSELMRSALQGTGLQPQKEPVAS